MEHTFTLNGRIWLEIAGEKVLGHGRVELLERIHESGSIRQAAIQMKMSYRQAWELIKHMNALFATPIVVSHRGGKGGGNAIVSAAGLKLINDFNGLQTRFKEFMQANNTIINQ